MKISATVWRREAVATQKAARAIAAFIGWCEQSGYHEAALLRRKAAMQKGTRRAARKMWRALAAMPRRKAVT